MLISSFVRFRQSLLALLLVAGLAPAIARPLPPPAPAAPTLAQALNPDGTLRAGASGSFDARQFTMGTAPDGRPVFRPSGTKGAGDFRWADGFELPNGTNGKVYAVVRAGTDVYIGGYFSVVGNVLVTNIAKWNGTAWSALGAGVGDRGLDNYVNALAVSGSGEVYAGGNFTQAGGIAATNIAKWNGTAWSALGAGVGVATSRDEVLALAVSGSGDVYAGGFFTQSGSSTVNHIARWNGTAWSSLGTGTANGLDGNVNALAVSGSGDVYVGGGGITQAGGVAANHVAKWNGTTWGALGAGVGTGNEGVRTLAVSGSGDVYAGGFFTLAGGAAAANVAKWNGTTWSALGAGVSGGYVNALAVSSSGEVYAGGRFIQAGGTAANYIAKWNGSMWSPLGTGTANGVNGYVEALAVSGSGEVYAGGIFTQAGGVAANAIAEWNGTAWNTLGTRTGNGINGDVHALAVAGNGDVYVGGYFTNAGSMAAANVARWNGSAWSALGTGVSGGYVNALVVSSSGEVYVGGSFTQAGGVAANHVAKWNGTTWSSLGTGISNNPYVNALAMSGSGELYVGGRFTQAGGVAANNVAKWNGTTWSALGTGVIATTSFYEVTALAVSGNGEVYAGGSFTQAGSVAANGVAKWNGTTWSALGNGISGANYEVFALATSSSGDVYVGGNFSQVGAVAANNVAKWNGTTWSALGLGVGTGNDGVGALAVSGSGELYVGGRFTQAGGIVANNVAKWNGTTWSSLGTGLNTGGYLAVGSNNKLYAGGGFNAVGDGSKLTVGFAIYDPAAVNATREAAAPALLQLFPNPTHGNATVAIGASRQPLCLLDALGREVRHYPAPTGPETTLDLRGLPAGVYVLQAGASRQRLVLE